MKMTEPDTEPEDDAGSDDVQLAEPGQVRGIKQNWNTNTEWDGTDYRSVPTPDPRERPYSEWGADERRAWLFEELKECGTWQNSDLTQGEVGDMFGVTQQRISKDLGELRRYIRFHAGDKAISMSEMVAQKAVADLMDSEPYKAWSVQREFNEFLFELGRIERAPDKKQVHNINEQRSDQDLDDDEKDVFENFAERMEQSAQGAQEPIDVESREVEDEDDD